MNLYKRPDSKFWWFRFVLSGVRYQQSSYETNRRKAETVAAAFRTNLIQTQKLGFTEKKPVPTFAEAVKEFLAYSEHQHRDKPRTHERYASASKPLLQFFKKTKLDGITPEMIERYKTLRISEKSTKTGRTRKPASVNRELVVLRLICGYFVKMDVLPKNPLSRVKLLTENNEQQRIISFEEQRIYLMAAPQPLRDVATLMLECGCRPEEICRLKRENVNLVEGWIFIPSGKTKAARRRIPLTETATNVLRTRMESHSHAFLFPHRSNPAKPIARPNWLHHSVLRKTKLPPFRMYDLRHSFASRLAMSGVDLVTLASLLGHAKIQMVMRYAHPSQEHQVEAVRKLEQFTARRGLKVA